MGRLTKQEIRPLLTGSKLDEKPKKLQALIVEAAEILSALGIPVATTTGRGLEKMAQAFLAVADVRRSTDWPNAKDLSSGRALKTRDIIEYENKHFAEKISSGSYDDIRRRDLRLPVAARVIIPSSPNAARNSPNRAYVLSPDAAIVVRQYGELSV